MTKRYLMRLGKSSFEAVDAFHTLDRNTLGTNNGNLIYGAASHNLFSTEGTVVETNRYQINAGMADRVNVAHRHSVLQERNTGHKRQQTKLRRDLDQHKDQSKDQLAQLSARLDEAEKRVAAAQQRAVEAEERTAKAEQKLAALGKQLRTTSATAARANDRSRRALRIPTRLRGVFSRLRP